MNRTPVVSRNLASVGYDDASATMEIEFVNGAVYQYFDVPRPIFDELVASGSVGAFFNGQVRGVYRFARA